MVSFSIIIPTLNEEKYLPGCLESIARLDYPNEKIEVILVDNGSRDSTLAIAKKAGVQTISAPGLKVSGLRNLGAKQAKNEILAFVDADCLVDRNWLKTAVRYANDHAIVIWGSPPVLQDTPTWVQRTWFHVRKKASQIETVPWLESMNFFIRSKDFEKIKGFNETLETCEDVDLCYRALSNGKIISDTRIKVVHLGEAPTLKIFFKKELWRGTSNYQGIYSHGFKIKELPSLIMPAYFLFFLPILVGCSLIYQNKVWFTLLALAFLFPIAGMFYKLRHKKIPLTDWPGVVFLVYFYFFARSVAVFRK